MDLISFRISGSFAAFRDPSVTSHQTVYFIPSKSALIGLIGAIIGVKRSNSLAELYSEEYLEFFKETKVGLRFESEPKKVVYFTNHRSLKEPKTKPIKSELVESPKYTLFVTSSEDYTKRIESTIANHDFVFSPYLGHAYCPCTISDLQKYDTHEVNPKHKSTSCVILDESETFTDSFRLTMEPDKSDIDSRIIVERHLHHFFNNGKFEARVLKHWIPVKNSFFIETISESILSKFVELPDQVVCLY